MMLADFITGKTIAIVGPAKSVCDQSAEVEACDTIIRCNYKWNGNEHVKNYGERIEIGFYNIAGARRILEKDELLEPIPYILLKERAPEPKHPHVSYAKKEPFPRANQVQIILNEIEQYEPAGVWIFGSDFYLSGPEGYYQDSYKQMGLIDQWKSIKFHDQPIQQRWLKSFQERTGLIKGDERMVELLSLTTDEVKTQLHDAWKEVIRKR